MLSLKYLLLFFPGYGRGGMVKEKILIADDDDRLNELLQDIFITEGYTVPTAYNGQETIEQLQKNRDTGVYYIETPKNSKPRRITVANAVLDLLREQKAVQERMRQMAGNTWDNKWNLVFTKDDGSNLAVNTVYHNYKKACKRD